MALPKKYNTNGQKAYQREDREDRSLIYRDWLRTVPVDGWFLDIDFIKFKKVEGEIKPVAITELTRCDKPQIGQGYLDAIIDRFFVRDSQGKTIQNVADKLGVPAYLVLFNKEMKWIWVFSFQKKEWREFTPQTWAEYLKKL